MSVQKRNESLARNLQAMRNSKFQTYPNSGTVRSQAIKMVNQLDEIIKSVPEGSEVPPWVVMKISKASEAVNSIHTYLTYYAKQ